LNAICSAGSGDQGDMTFQGHHSTNPANIPPLVFRSAFSELREMSPFCSNQSPKQHKSTQDNNGQVKMLLALVLMKQIGTTSWQSQCLLPLGIHSQKKVLMAAVLKLIRFGHFACMSCEENATMTSVLGSMRRTMVMETLISIRTLILIMQV
jgi:hypothetical protein